MDWRIKAVGSCVLSRMPGQGKLRRLVQQWCGASRHEWPVDRTLSFGRNLVRVCRECGLGLDGKDVLEIGTGWVPLIPAFMWLCGARSCRTYDIERLLSETLTISAFRDAVEYLAEENWEDVSDERLEALKAAAERGRADVLLELCGIEYHAPADASRTALPSGSVDVVFSNNVLEHVTPSEVVPLLAEARRLLRPEGITVHTVDLSDHYSHSDPSLPRNNFLRYPDWQFRWINNGWIYQNRLRPCHYREILDAAGLRLLKWDVRIDERSLRHVREMTVAPRFRGLPEEELCADALTFAAR